MSRVELAEAVPHWPDGHVNNSVKSRRYWLVRVIEDGIRKLNLDTPQELNGLVARAKYLIANPPAPSNTDTPPDGGSAEPMRIAA